MHTVNLFYPKTLPYQIIVPLSYEELKEFESVFLLTGRFWTTKLYMFHL